MDTDWCLTCDKHFEGNGPYCSLQCKNIAGPSSHFQSTFNLPSSSSSYDDFEDVDYHNIADVHPKAYWSGNGPAGIRAWAADIPEGAPTGGSPPPSDASSISSTTYRPPNLIRPNRPIPPALCMSKSQPTPPTPTKPIVTPQKNSTDSIYHSSDIASIGETSLLSAITDSSLATPASAHLPPLSSSRKPSVIGSIASHVRSWVSSPPHTGPSKQKFSTPLFNDGRPHSFRVSHPVIAVAGDEATPLWWMSSTVFVTSTTKHLPKLRTEPLELPTGSHTHSPPMARSRRISHRLA